MTGYAKKSNDNTTMSFIVKNKQLFKNYSKIWDKIEQLMKINFKSNPVYDDDIKYIKTKIKIYAGSVIINFHNKKMLIEKAPCKCLSIIVLDSGIKATKNTICKHFQKNANIHKKK